MFHLEVDESTHKAQGEGKGGAGETKPGEVTTTRHTTKERAAVVDAVFYISLLVGRKVGFSLDFVDSFVCVFIIRLH